MKRPETPATLPKKRRKPTQPLRVVERKWRGARLSEARLRARRPALPIVLITGYPTIQCAVRGIGFGASEYVSKPFTPEALREVVARVVASAVE